MTRLSIVMMFTLAFAPFAPFAAQAGGGCGGGAMAKVQSIFDRADADSDGLLTKSEYEEAGLQDYGLSFEQSDLDDDGRTSLDEYIELYEAHHPPIDRQEV